MPNPVIDNFDLKAEKFNFERDCFDTLAKMKAFPEAGVPDQFATFCLETKKAYRIDKSNNVDSITGKWREVEYVNIEIGSLKKLPYGSVPTVTNTGIGTTPILNFGIPEGAPGPRGPMGSDGSTWKPSVNQYGYLSWSLDSSTSAPEEYLVKGPQGTPGRDGSSGKDGADGIDGLSAYEIAVKNGFVGTEEEWLESLKGSGTGGSGLTEAQKTFLGSNADLQTESKVSLPSAINEVKEEVGKVCNGVGRFISIIDKSAGTRVLTRALFYQNGDILLYGKPDGDGLVKISQDGKVITKAGQDTRTFNLSNVCLLDDYLYTPGQTWPNTSSYIQKRDSNLLLVKVSEVNQGIKRLFSFCGKLMGETNTGVGEIDIDTLVYNQIISFENFSYSNVEENFLWIQANKVVYKYNEYFELISTIDLTATGVSGVPFSSTSNQLIITNSPYEISIYGKNEIIRVASNYLNSTAYNSSYISIGPPILKISDYKILIFDGKILDYKINKDAKTIGNITDLGIGAIVGAKVDGNVLTCITESRLIYKIQL